MTENEVYEYTLNFEEKEQSLKMSIRDNNIYLAILKKNGERYSGLVSLSQIKQVCKEFNTSKTLNEAIIILHNTIEGGNIFLTEDELEKNIELKFAIKLASGDFPPFSIFLELEKATPLKEPKQEPIPPKIENKIIKEPTNSTKKAKKVNNPLAKSNANGKKVSAPAKTAKSTKLSSTGMKPNIGHSTQLSQDLISSVQQQNKLNLANIVDNSSTKYSIQTVPLSANNNIQNSTNIIDNNIILQNKQNESSIKYSQYSTYSVPSKSVVYSDNNYLETNTYDYTQNNNVIEYSPDLANLDIFTNNSNTNTNTFSSQPTYDYNNNNYTDYTNYNDYTDSSNSNYNYNNYINDYTNNYTNDYTNNYSNYTNNYTNNDTNNSTNDYSSNIFDQNNYTNYSNTTDYPIQNNSSDLSSYFQSQVQNQDGTYNNQNYDYQYQTSNNYATSSTPYSQSFPQQFEQAFAEVIPLNPNNDFLSQQKEQEKKGENTQEKLNQPKEAINEEKTQETKTQEEKNEEENKEKGEEHQNNEEENKEEGEEHQNNEEEQQNGKENEEVGEKEENEGEEGEQKNEEENKEEEHDIETLYRTEEGLIIFRNGISQGIIRKYSEIDNVVTKIQDILLKGAKFNLVYKATIHDDKASTFHQKCDDNQMSLVLVETDKGVRFGGFTTKTWKGHCEKKIDNDAFVFSVDNNKIYEIIQNEPAIGCYPKFGPVFFGCQIRIYNDFFSKGGSTCFRGLNYKTVKDFELNNGEQTYLVKDIEVYNIETIDI